MPFYLLLLIIVSLSGLTMVAMALAYRSPAGVSWRLRPGPAPGASLLPTSVSRRAYAVRTALNAIFSGGLVFALVYATYDQVFYEAAPAWWRSPVEALAILVVYDFLYYLLHRYPFHQWGYLKRVHAVHHRAKRPNAVDSLFLHPVENFLGLALLMSCTWLVGPVHLYSFAAAFFVYSQINVIVHGGLDLPRPLRFLGAMARKHDRHHQSMRAGNYASITPLPDLVFRTAE
jgi:sterol desaturase/sphingolipid hydroxylase (fatty acid hydroxylase superfamily)